MPTTRLSVLLPLLTIAALVGAESMAVDFAEAKAVEGFTLSGDGGFDAERTATAGGGGSLRLGPKAKVVLPLRAEDGSGRIAFKVYEDGAAATDPKARGVGATWGVSQADGRSLVVGALYAPYLSGAETYALSNFLLPKDTVFSFVRYLGITRAKGWHAWTFDFDAAKGLTISCDGTVIETKRFDWMEAKQVGFNALVFSGDTTDAAGQLWIDDISVTLGGPMQVAPLPPPPPPAVVPDQDPAVEGEAADLVAAVRDVHPRLLFGPEEIPALKEFYASEQAKDFRAALDAYLPACIPSDEVKFLKDATDGQRQGYWRMPTVALHYVLTGDKGSFDKTVGYMKLLLTLPHWELGDELDSGMSAANIMIGAGLALDWLWNDLDPAFREEFRRKCLYHARAMYHGGHLLKNNDVHYWQGDPANNHRWHRNVGFASCLLAAYTGAEEEKWILTQLKNEFEYVVKWLPADGTSHESPGYMIFGLSHLVLGAQEMDRCLGTSHLQNPFFKNEPRYFVASLMPDVRNHFNYGDMGGTGVGKLGYDLCMYKCASVHGLKEEQAMLDRIRVEKGIEWGWMGLLWCDPKLSGGSTANLQTSTFFDDVGVLFARDAWKEDGVGVMFKCGPLGGYTLNRFRNDNGFRYINVAHDDPDANTFLIYAANDYLVESDRYSERKKSANHNTILVNGLGQMAEGRPEGAVWSQPANGNVDMAKQSVITAVKLTERINVIEGEAGGAYIAVKGERPALERFRRALVFAKGEYVLVLDDIRAPEAVDFSWLIQGPDLQPVADRPGTYRLIGKAGGDCPFQVVTNRDNALKASVIDSPADTKGKKLLGFKQLRLETRTDRLVAASVYDVYHRGLSVALDASDPAKIVATVSGGEIADRWEWVPSADAGGVYDLTGQRSGQMLIQVGAGDRPEDPMKRVK